MRSTPWPSLQRLHVSHDRRNHERMTYRWDVSFVGPSNSLSNEKYSNGHSKSRVRNYLRACLSRQHIFLERLQKRELHRNLPRNL